MLTEKPGPRCLLAYLKETDVRVILILLFHPPVGALDKSLKSFLT